MRLLGKSVGKFCREIPGYLPHCHGLLIEIDHYGERLVGCIECNRWSWRSWRGSNRRGLSSLGLLLRDRCSGQAPLARITIIIAKDDAYWLSYGCDNVATLS